MGSVISQLQYSNANDIYRLVIFLDESNKSWVSLRKLLSEELLRIKPTRRTMQMEKALLKVLEKIPVGATIKDIDVLFNPEYKIDVLRTMIDVNKKHSFKVIWPGTYEEGRLIYSEEGLSDYKTYEISDYDIVCVV